MKRILSSLLVGAVLLSTGLAFADTAATTAKPSAVKVKKAYKAKPAAKSAAKHTAKPAAATTTQKPL